MWINAKIWWLGSLVEPRRVRLAQPMMDWQVILFYFALGSTRDYVLGGPDAMLAAIGKDKS